MERLDRLHNGEPPLKWNIKKTSYSTYPGVGMSVQEYMGVYHILQHRSAS